VHGPVPPLNSRTGGAVLLILHSATSDHCDLLWRVVMGGLRQFVLAMGTDTANEKVWRLMA
jgi:hypothetical protein